MIEILTIVILLGILGVAAYQDWKMREVMDWVWITLFVFGLGINGVKIFTARNRLLVRDTIIFTLIIATSIGFLLSYFSLWGDGDLLVYISAAFVTATLPVPYFFPNAYEILPFCVSALVNAFIVVVVFSLYHVLQNIYRKFLKLKTKSNPHSIPFLPALLVGFAITAVYGTII